MAIVVSGSEGRGDAASGTGVPLKIGEIQRHYQSLTPGKLMGLHEITDSHDRFKVFALDQSNSMKKAIRALFQKRNITREVGYEDVRDAKLAMARVITPLASAVLLDVNFGLAQALCAGILPKGVGLLARLEASKDPGLPGEVEPGWGVEKIKRMGASAVKLLVYLDVEDKKSTDAQMVFVKRTAEECRQYDILLLIEELSYPRQNEAEKGEKKSPAYLQRKPQNILGATKLIGPFADVLKLEFPADMKSATPQDVEARLKALDEAAIRPWVLLSAGEQYDLFVKQVELAMKAGASGIMAGRAIFNEFFEQDSPEAQEHFLKGTATNRMKELTALVDRYATPWLQAARLSREALAKGLDPKWYLDGARGMRDATAVAPSSRSEY